MAGTLNSNSKARSDKLCRQVSQAGEPHLQPRLVAHTPLLAMQVRRKPQLLGHCHQAETQQEDGCKAKAVKANL